jgi:hypothetical protein
MDKLKMVFWNLIDKLRHNMSGSAGAHIRYGQVKGHQLNVGGFAWAATQVVKNKGGKFVYSNAGALTLCVATTTTILGWAQERERTPTEGDLCTVNVAWDAIYRMPLITGTTFVIGMRGDSADIENGTSVEGNTTVQCCAPGTTTRLTLFIVDGDTVDSKWADVMMNPYPAVDRPTVAE